MYKIFCLQGAKVCHSAEHPCSAPEGGLAVPKNFKTLAIGAILGLFCAMLNAQAPTKQWDKRYGGNGQENNIRVIYTNDEGYIISIRTTSSMNGDVTQPSPAGGDDYWVLKINSNGVKMWDKLFGGSGHDDCRAIRQTNDGGYVLAGHSNSPISGDKTENSRGDYDYWVVKLDNAGTKVWDKTYGGTGNELCHDIRQTADGGYIVAGSSASGIGGDKTQASQGGRDAWLVKLDGSGNLLWERRFGGTGTETFYSIIQTPDGGYLAYGDTDSPVSGDVSASQRGGADLWLMKIDASGTKVWDQRYGTTATENTDGGITALSTGEYLLVGRSNGGIDNDKSEASFGGEDFWVVKVNSAGTKIWDKVFGGSSNDGARDVLEAMDGGYLIAGITTSGVSGNKTSPSQGGYDFWLVKTNASGTKEWDKVFGTSSTELSISVAEALDGNYLVAGTSDAGVDGDKCQLSRGGTDAWIVKTQLTALYTQAHAKEWDKRYGGTSDDGQADRPTRILPTSDGGYLIFGSALTSDGDWTAPSLGSRDFVAVKMDASGAKQWDKRYGGTNDEYCRAARATNDGGYILGGITLSGMNGDISEASRGNQDFWILKIDAAGNKLWDKRFGGTGNDRCFDITLTNDGGYILTGDSDSGISGDKTEDNRGSTDFWVVKTDASGAKLWDKRFGSTDTERASSVWQTPDGGYIAAGRANATSDADVTDPTRGGADYWVVRMDASGNKIWDKRYGSSATDNLSEGAMIRISTGGYLMVGGSTGGVSGDKTEASRGGEDYWAVRIDEAGTKVWDRCFGGGATDTGTDVIETSDGNFVICGTSSSGAGSDKSEAAVGSTDYWLVKIDACGNKAWDKTFGGTSSETRPTVAQTANGYIIGGMSTSGVGGDKTETAQGGLDFWIVKTGFVADMSISVAPPTQSGNQGELLTYVVTLTNAGPTPAPDVTVKVPMPGAIGTLASTAATQGSYNAVTGVWDLGFVPLGSQTLTFTIKIN